MCRTMCRPTRGIETTCHDVCDVAQYRNRQEMEYINWPEHKRTTTAISMIRHQVYIGSCTNSDELNAKFGGVCAVTTTLLSRAVNTTNQLRPSFTNKVQNYDHAERRANWSTS